MDSNGQKMVVKVISVKEIAITPTFSTPEVLNPVRKWSFAVHEVYAVFETLPKLVIVQHSLGFSPGDLLVPLWKSYHLALKGR